MAWYDKYVPKELKKGADELLDFGSSVIEKGVTKPFASLSDKLIPNELRFLAPYAAGIGTLMLPPGMGPLMRGLSGAGFNILGQIAADETPVEDISDLNALSIALAGGLGALGSRPDSFNQGVSGANKAAFTQPGAYGEAAAPITGADYERGRNQFIDNLNRNNAARFQPSFFNRTYNDKIVGLLIISICTIFIYYFLSNLFNALITLCTGSLLTISFIFNL